MPSGDFNPPPEEIREEIKRFQTLMRACVSVVNASRLSRPAHAVLGRAYRSFQYEVTTVVNNIKRRFGHVRVSFIDLPEVRALRYREIGDFSTLQRLFLIDHGKQANTLLEEYQRLVGAYKDPRAYIQSIREPGLIPLREFSPVPRELAEEREEYIAQAIEEVGSDLHIVRYAHLVDPQPEGLDHLGIISTKPLIQRVKHLEPAIITLDDASKIIGFAN